jgi:hypothetical protein
MFIDPTKASFGVDIWSLAASLFHLVAKELPFECSTPIVASVNITDMTNTAPDVRDKSPASYRDQISPMLAGAIAKGLQKDVGKRFQSTDEMCMAFHRCLVQQRMGAYSVYISYDHSSNETLSNDRICAALLYNALNNTETKAKHRVFACMRPLELKATESWEGFAVGFQNSLLAIPILSKATIKRLESLKGSKDDEVDCFLMEVILMKALTQNQSERIKFQKITPFLLHTSSHASGDTVSAHNLVPRESIPSKNAASDFLKSSGVSIDLDEALNDCSVQGIIDAIVQAEGSLIFSPSVGSENQPSTGTGTEKGNVSGDDSEIIERLCKLKILEEDSVSRVLSWKEEVKQIATKVYDEIDKASAL